jgi:hypothetical protein
VQPALERPGRIRRQRAEHPDEHVLGEVLGVVGVAGQAIGQPENPRRVLADHFFPRRRCPVLRNRNRNRMRLGLAGVALTANGQLCVGHQRSSLAGTNG